MFKRIYRYFSKPLRLSILNGVLILVLIVLNTYFQAFCIPTTWASIVLSICFLNTILYPILQNYKIAPLTSFINGISLFVFIYCVIFLEHINLYGIILIIIGIGFVIFIPHFFVAQLIVNTFKPSNKALKPYFFSSIILCIVLILYVGYDYKKAINSIKQFEESNYTELDKNFMTEKILGMHFIYHTAFCEFDGWRPPKHEPILVIGMWLNKRVDPLDIDLKARLRLYQNFFPENGYKFDCSCGIEYSKSYHYDDFWGR